MTYNKSAARIAQFSTTLHMQSAAPNPDDYSESFIIEKLLHDNFANTIATECVSFEISHKLHNKR